MTYVAEEVPQGLLMSYGQDTPDLFRRTAVYVDKILKGAKPADLLGGASSGGLSTTVPLVLSTGVPVGAVIAVAVIEVSTVLGSCNDEANNTYSVAATISGVNFNVAIFTANVTTALTSGQLIRYNIGAGAGYQACVAGLVATGSNGSLDSGITATASGGNTTSTTPSVISGTPVNPDCLFLAAIGGLNNPQFNQDTADGWATPFDNQLNNLNACIIAGGNQVGTTFVIPFQPTFTVAGYWAAVIVGSQILRTKQLERIPVI
jgi:hypothetical protein